MNEPDKISIGPMRAERTELDILREQVHALEHSESTALVEKIFQHTRTAEELAEANTKIERLEAALFDANASLHELKTLVLIGPLTAEEWLEFRLRREEDEDHELLRCCANTSAIRDDVFYLARSYAEDPLLGRAVMRRIIHGINGHLDLITGPHPAALRLHELLNRMADYYGVPMDYVHNEDHPEES